MELKETSRPHSTFMLNRLRVGFQIHMLLSAPGRAYLAFCPDAERDSVLQRMRAARDPASFYARDTRFVTAVLTETRNRGYGVRDPRWGGHYSEPKSRYDDGLNAIAVPIVHHTTVLGCINLVWIRKLFTHEVMARKHLSDLKSAAGEIARAYDLRVPKTTGRKTPGRALGVAST
jgi:IclR family mhp operon transcriptional activator